jgi:hypothetical protein
VDIDPVDSADVYKIAQAIQRRANESGTAVSVVDKLSLGRHRCAVTAGALAERGCLTFNGVRGRLLFAGDTRVERLEWLS